jgi:predicted lipoprotein with Yx(FWY)xxD motif
VKRLAAVAVLAGALAAAPGVGAMSKAPVIVIKTQAFGRVLAAPNHLALYYWTPEKRDHRIHCTGSCLRAWPPLVVRSASAVAKRLALAHGRFGTIRRPDGRLQVTYNRLPLYTYHADPRNRPLCNNVDGWFVVRA